MVSIINFLNVYVYVFVYNLKINKQNSKEVVVCENLLRSSDTVSKNSRERLLTLNLYGQDFLLFAKTTTNGDLCVVS